MKLKNYFIFSLIFSLIFIAQFCIHAQDLTFTFANAQNTNDGSDNFYEVDVMAASTAGFELGSSQVYINFNTGAFGTNVHANGALTITRPEGSVLAKKVLGSFDFYESFTQNDNTDSRFSFSWQQAGFSSACLGGNNITNSAGIVFHVKVKYTPGGFGQHAGFCFEGSGIFGDQTFTACGPSDSCTSKNCTAAPNAQITNDNFSCSGAALPIELLFFKAETTDNRRVQLSWQTATEQNNDFYSIEKSRDGFIFETIDEIPSLGNTNHTQDYQTWDENPFLGINYYRLKQTDFNGTFSYSDIRSVHIEGFHPTVLIYPNPTKELLHIQISEPQKFTSFQLMDYTGRVLLNEAVLDIAPLDISHLPQGTYLLKIFMNNDVLLKRILIQ